MARPCLPRAPKARQRQAGAVLAPPGLLALQAAKPRQRGPGDEFAPLWGASAVLRECGSRGSALDPSTVPVAPGALRPSDAFLGPPAA